MITKLSAEAIFGFDLTDPRLRSEVPKQMPQSASQTITVDFSGCLIDYPATSAISDAVFSNIQAASSPRSVTFRFNVNFPELLLLKWFFIGSETLLLHNGSLTEAQIKASLESHLKQWETSLNIQIVNPETGAVEASFRYGQQQAS